MIATADDPLLSVYGHLSDVVQAMSCGLVVLRDDGVVIEINPATAELFETPAETLLWKSVDAYIVPRRYSLDAMFDHLIDPSTEEELRVQALGRTATGRELDLLLSMRLMHQRQPGATQRAAVCTILDLTAERRLERELAYAQKLQAVAQLATGVVHELSTPVQFLGDRVQFLSETIEQLAGTSRDDFAEDESLRDLEHSIRAAQRGLSRIHEIIDAVRSFSNPRQRERTATALRPIVDDTLVVARSAYKHVAQVEVDDTLTRDAMCCPADIRQVVLSLVVNAAQALGEVEGSGLGTIRVELRDGERGEAIIRVCDNGPGIPEDVRSRIFDPYFSTKAPDIGTGQGLAIAKQLVESHGGHLTLLSSQHGATFDVSLPAVQHA